ncbi:hypothetical protein CRM22_010907, partial [Opisthorchis felineus]
VADDNRNVFVKRTVSAVGEIVYVDDRLVSVESDDIAKEPVCQISSTLSLGGARLQKWANNSPEVLNVIPISERACRLVDFNISDSSLHNTLGLYWSIKPECFRYK